MESVSPNRTPTIGTVSRMAVLGLALSCGGHQHEPKHTPAQTELNQECTECIDPSMLAPGTSLEQRRIVLRRKQVRDMIIYITRENGGIRLNVNGKTYGVRDNPMAVGVRIGQIIDSVSMGDGAVHLSATGYGHADVTREEVER
jgi:hypothetical protein